MTIVKSELKERKSKINFRISGVKRYAEGSISDRTAFLELACFLLTYSSTVEKGGIHNGYWTHYEENGEFIINRTGCKNCD